MKNMLASEEEREGTPYFWVASQWATDSWSIQENIVDVCKL